MSSEHAVEQVPLAEIQEGDTIQGPQSGQWITVTRTAEGTTSVIHKYSDGERRTCFPNRLPTARATTPSGNERFKDKRMNGERFRSCVLAHPREIHLPGHPAFARGRGCVQGTRRVQAQDTASSYAVANRHRDKMQTSDGRWCRRHRWLCPCSDS
jgi:hypothetical protein